MSQFGRQSNVDLQIWMSLSIYSPLSKGIESIHTCIAQPSIFKDQSTNTLKHVFMHSIVLKLNSAFKDLKPSQFSLKCIKEYLDYWCKIKYYSRYNNFIVADNNYSIKQLTI